MKRVLMMSAAALALLLGGCASTIRSDVTTFHQWPAEMADKSYTFAQAPAQDNTLELQSYQDLVRAELARLGFREVDASATAALKVAMRFTTTDVPTRVLEPVFPPVFPMRLHFMMSHPFHRNLWSARRYWGGWYSPFYDPFWFNMPQYTETVRHFYKRELQVQISSVADRRQLFDVTVDNTSGTMSTPAVMPALVRSAFLEFPGVSGAARKVELKREG